MSKLRAKSEFNIQAAHLLIRNNLFAPSIHCSYYSCFQLMKYTLNDFFGIEYSNLSQMIATNKSNTHTYIIKYISDQIRQKIGREDYREFSNKIKDLKTFREQSDYDDIEVSIDEGQKAYNHANEILSFLRNNFHV